VSNQHFTTSRHFRVGVFPGSDLGVVWPQAIVIPGGAPTAPYPNNINNVIKFLLKDLQKSNKHVPCYRYSAAILFIYNFGGAP